MTEDLRHSKLNTSIENIIAGRQPAATGDAEVDVLARLASGLRGLPAPGFKARLGTELLPETGRRRWWPFRNMAATQQGAERDQQRGLVGWIKSLVPAAPWSKRHRAFAAAGGSCGLVAGACCLSGAAASVLGIASAAAVSAFIDSTLPYFVATSIVALLSWLVWDLRPQGFTLRTVAVTIRRQGLAMGTAYGVVFGASMALTMAMGLY